MGASCCVLLSNMDSSETEKLLAKKEVKKENKSFESRLIDVLVKHKSVFIDNEQKHNIMEFMNSFNFHNKQYDLIQFLNDFNDYLFHEKSNQLYAEQFYSKLIQKSKQKCEIAKCVCIKRNVAGDNEALSLYNFNDVQNKTEVEKYVYHQLIDNIHVHVFHSFDMAFKLSQKDKEQFNNKNDNDIQAKMSDFIQKKLNNYKNEITKGGGNSFVHNQFNKFQTKICTDATITFYDSLLKHLSLIKINKNICKLLQRMITEEEYDSDALFYDVNDLYENNVKSTIRDSSTYDVINKYFKVNDPNEILYSFGYRFYYWDFYKDKHEETTVIFELEADEKTEQRKVQTRWYDKGNKRYNCCEWYIPQKYTSLKDEILNNPVENIDLQQWNVSTVKVDIKFQESACRKLKANQFWQTAYSIAYKSFVSQRHIMALLLYCNYTTLCSAFSATFRRSSLYESNISLISRHQNYHNFAKLLRELVEAFGTQFMYSRERKFFHGINVEMYFKNCYARICGPMSTTTDICIAAGTFAKDDGIVLELENDKQLTFYMDCSQFSCFSNESECLFIGGFSQIPFISIRNLNRTPVAVYEDSVQAISILTKMFSGDFTLYAVTKKNVKSIQGVMTGNGVNDSYVSKSYGHFCLNIKSITFNTLFMTSNNLGHYPGLDHKVYGYKPLYTIFYDETFDMVNLSLLLNLFSNLEKVVIEKWTITDKYEKSNIFSRNLMNYILSALKKSQSIYTFKQLLISFSIPFETKNSHCLKQHLLESYKTECDGYTCDKCGSKFSQGTELFVCFKDETDCDYCVCTDCYQHKNNSIVYIKEAIAEYQPLFAQIEWKIEITVYRNEKHKEFDAISFIK
eukprot:230008_1